jgi:hypothetical protein
MFNVQEPNWLDITMPTMLNKQAVLFSNFGYLEKIFWQPSCAALCGSDDMFNAALLAIKLFRDNQVFESILLGSFSQPQRFLTALFFITEKFM